MHVVPGWFPTSGRFKIVNKDDEVFNTIASIL